MSLDIFLFFLFLQLVYFLFYNPQKIKNDINAASVSYNVSGFAWSENIGWISFNCNNTGSCGTSDYKVKTSFSFNLSPVASISCDASGCNSSDCIGYNGGCIFTLNNDSTDPDGQDDIVKSEWTITSQASGQIVNQLTCTTASDPLCNWTLPSSFSSGDYTANLYVEDTAGISSETTTQFTVKQEAIAGFVCSLDGTNWQDCGDVHPTKDQVVYFSDNQPDPLEHSSPSEDATAITNRVWDVDGTVFSSDNQSNVTTTIPTSGPHSVTLTITDNQNREVSETHQVGVTIRLPKWKEVAP